MPGTLHRLREVKRFHDRKNKTTKFDRVSQAGGYLSSSVRQTMKELGPVNTAAQKPEAVY